VNGLCDIGTRSHAFKDLVRRAERAAVSAFPVLLHGETGTGKEVFARGIHRASGRKGAFVPINCSAIPDSLAEAELFGAKRGAYTGLDGDRKGLFRAADGGTLFLDEIGDLALPMQAKLLRVLDDGEIRPVGGTDSVKVDARIVSASHESLSEMVKQGLFRQDLFFRLTTVFLQLPSLRERPEDIPDLFREAVAETSVLLGWEPPEIEPAVLEAAGRHAWPGNVRELFHVVSAAMITCETRRLTLVDFPSLGGGRPSSVPPSVLASELPPPDHEAGVRDGPRDGEALPPFFEALAAFERQYIARLLGECEGNISRAAHVAGISRAAVRAKGRLYGLVGLGGGEEADSEQPPTPASERRLRQRVRIGHPD
jgi:DNA-binding NtrC family response regulator